MSRSYKNIVKLNNKSFGKERRENLAKEIVKDSTPMPQPLEYEDIDKEFNKWVKEELQIIFEGEMLPTFALFSNQRFSEFLQSWDEVDEKKNLIMNFKTVTRENNPKAGTIVGNSRNIPGEHYMLMKRVEAYDKANRRYFIDYKVKQPISIDFIYTVGIVTNKYSLLNDFNLLMNDKFKSIDCYIRPNGHFIPMKLNEISDESEYNIDNRTYYSQNYSITVMAYIMPRDSFKVEEVPELKFIGFEGDKKGDSYAEIEELPCHMEKPEVFELGFQPVNIKIHISKCSTNYKFTIDTNFKTKEIIIDNIRSYKLYINDNEININKENIIINNGDEVKIKNIIRFKTFEDSEIIFKGEEYKIPLNKNDISEIKEISWE